MFLKKWKHKSEIAGETSGNLFVNWVENIGVEISKYSFRVIVTSFIGIILALYQFDIVNPLIQ